MSKQNEVKKEEVKTPVNKEVSDNPETPQNEALTSTSEQKKSEVQPNSQIEDAIFVENQHDTHVPNPIEETKENKAIVKEHEEFTEKVASGEKAVGLNATQLSELQKPLVPNPIGGKPVFETASAYDAWMAANGGVDPNAK